MVDGVQRSVTVRSSGPPSNEEIATEEDPVRQQILAAMQRMILGHPKHVPLNAGTVSDLAKEAKVGRHHLYQSHPDLRERYEHLRYTAGHATEREIALQLVLDRTKDELIRVKELQVRTREEIDNLRGATENFARIINVLQAELHQERLKAERLLRRLQRYKEDFGELSTVVQMHRPRERDKWTED